MTMGVSVVGIGQIPVSKKAPVSLREMGAQALKAALEDASLAEVDAIYVANMLADEMSGQKHVGALIASHVGLSGVAALQVRAATASGAAALHVGCMAIASGKAKRVAVVGVECMSTGSATAVLSKALDAKQEVNYGMNMLSANAKLFELYMDRYGVPYERFAPLAINAHRNAVHNPNALFQEAVAKEAVLTSRVIVPPLRLFDCSPVCDGAAAVILSSTSQARSFHEAPVEILASTVATDHFVIEDRSDCLDLVAARKSAIRAYEEAQLGPGDIDFCELHDAFSIIGCLLLESTGFVERGQGWRMIADGDIFLGGRLPVSTMGGLKARGHPIGATGVYQAVEIVTQLRGFAGPNQLPLADIALTNSVGGAGATVITHILAR